MRQSLRKILVGAACFLLIFVVAVAGYVLAGWNLLDAIYMVVITVFGVGFGEMGPMTPPLRIFTIFVIVAGYTAVVYIVGGFLQMVAEGELNKALGARRMTREIANLREHIIICGFGRIGQILARKLVDAKIPFVVIDNSPDRIAAAEQRGYLVRLGNASDEVVLDAAGIQRAKALATVLPDDAINVFITLTARDLNTDLIILARGELPTTEKKLRQAGADHTVLPAAIGALRMAHLITHPAALDFLDQNDDGGINLNESLAQLDIQLDELVISGDSSLIGLNVSSVQLRGEGTFIVVALRRADSSTIINPGPEIFLEKGDTVIVMGHRGDIPRFASHYALKRQTKWGARH